MYYDKDLYGAHRQGTKVLTNNVNSALKLEN